MFSKCDQGRGSREVKDCGCVRVGGRGSVVGERRKGVGEGGERGGEGGKRGGD